MRQKHGEYMGPMEGPVECGSGRVVFLCAVARPYWLRRLVFLRPTGTDRLCPLTSGILGLDESLPRPEDVHGLSLVSLSIGWIEHMEPLMIRGGISLLAFIGDDENAALLSGAIGGAVMTPSILLSGAIGGAVITPGIPIRLEFHNSTGDRRRVRLAIEVDSGIARDREERV